ncbi:Choline transport protein [Tolypocladium ophioglossoides CBS 100239]|uniref:Choline transport protein n=1 Tax=Tolypocladium ophioglossoides (strain CBS 100239) TaxID=1163406 RepID=A0A0L0NHS0_TOLOC|nr:Choline transport protein [Tolypocladium ophioglossoides CBS 100239]
MMGNDSKLEKMDASGSTVDEGDIGHGLFSEFGYKQELERKFSSLQLLCYAFTTTNSWLGLTGGFTAGILTGGTVCIVWGLVITAFASTAVGLALSELISAYPNAGGTYFWAMQLAPRRYSRVSAYITGWANVFGAWCCGAANMTIAAGWIFAAVRLFNPDLNLETWQYYLLAVGVNIGLSVFNLNVTVLTKFATLGFLTSVIGLVCVTIATPASARTTTDVKFIFASTENVSGWSSFSVAFMTGLVNSSWCFAVLDSATHLAEEIPHPERNVPKAIMSTVILGFITCFPMACVFMYSMPDLDKVAAAELTGSPLLELFYLSSGSKAISLFLILCVITPFLFAVVALHTYQSRLLWAFSRDHGTPFSHIWSQVHPKFRVPLYAHICSIGINLVLSALQLASTTAYNSFIIGGLVCPLMSCILPVFWSLWRGEDQRRGPVNLGKIGIVAKVITLIYCFFTLIMYSFPYAIPVAPGNMNYISVIFAGMALLLTIDWFLRARKKFTMVE